jgi:pimeloyl-ACP methyl ester carboxylesterase
VTAAEQVEHLRLAARIAGLQAHEVVAPAEGHLVLDDIRLHYLDWGSAGRPPVVFLHGGCLTAHTWDLVCLALRDSHHCLALDQRGHGDSEWSPTLDYGREAHARDIAAFLDHLRLRRPVLVGQSMGGLNAMTYAARRSETLAGLVVIDTGPWVSREGAERIADFVMDPAEPESLEELVERAQAFNPRRDVRLLRRSLQHNLRRLPDGRWTWKYDQRWISRATFERLHASLRSLQEEISAIICPTLVVRGALSDVVTNEDAARFAAELPDGRLVRIADAGHTVQGDNPLELAGELRDFLAGLDR